MEKLNNVHARLHDVGKCENFRLGNFLTFACIYFNEVYEIYMLIFRHWFLIVQGGHSLWNSLNCSGIFSVLEFLWKNGKILDIFEKCSGIEVFWNSCHLQSCKNRPQVAASWLCLKLSMHLSFATVHLVVFLLDLALFLLCLCILMCTFIYVYKNGCNFLTILI